MAIASKDIRALGTQLDLSDDQMDILFDWVLARAGELGTTGSATKSGKPEKTKEQKKQEKTDYEATLVALTTDEHLYVQSHYLEQRAEVAKGNKAAYSDKQRLFGFASPFALKKIATEGTATAEYKAIIAKMLAADQAQPKAAVKRVAKKSA